MSRLWALGIALLLTGGCATLATERAAQSAAPAQASAPPSAAAPAPVPEPVLRAAVPAASCTPEIERLRAQLAAEVAERQRLTRAAAQQEETLRRQLDAFLSAERGILQREERIKTEKR